MTILPAAHCKLVLHAAKHPCSPVLGLLIGYRSSGAWVIVDSVALFHSHALYPMLELGFLQTEEYCARRGAQEDRPLQIVGCYSGNEISSEMTSLSVLAKRVASKINGLVRDPVVLLVDAEGLGEVRATRRFLLRDGRR